jgi:proteic killer suppression protein
MIESFKHKGLKELFVDGKTKRLPQERLEKIKKILAIINAAVSLEDLNVPAFRLHKLKAPPYQGYWSIDVSANYRILFEFADGKATNIDYLDTH